MMALLLYCCPYCQRVSGYLLHVALVVVVVVVMLCVCVGRVCVAFECREGEAQGCRSAGAVAESGGRLAEAT